MDDGKVWFDLLYTDLVGVLRSVSYRIERDALKGFSGKTDGSSVYGFSPIEDSDLILRTVDSSISHAPWAEYERYVGIAAIFKGSERFIKDPRLVAENVEQLLSKDGISAQISGELEFYIVKEFNIDMGRDLSGYYQKLEIKSSELSQTYRFPVKRSYHLPLDLGIEELIKYLSEKLSLIATNVRLIHHEVAVSQYEMNVNQDSPSIAADRLQLLKLSIRKILASRGLIPIFMPKPFWGDNGSGLHIHVSLWSNGANLFYDSTDTYAGISQTARYFIGGLLEHGASLSAIVSPSVNSYRRLIPGYEAPIYLTWGRMNRSAAVRLPYSDSMESTRIEYRPPDPLANPYLAFSAVILAGIDGIKKKIDPGDPIDENVYKLDPVKKMQLGIKSLPRNLEEALDSLESDNEYLRPAFPKELLETYIELKRDETRKMQQYPSVAEYIEYMHI